MPLSAIVKLLHWSAATARSIGWGYLASMPRPVSPPCSAVPRMGDGRSRHNHPPTSESCATTGLAALSWRRSLRPRKVVFSSWTAWGAARVEQTWYAWSGDCAGEPGRGEGMSTIAEFAVGEGEEIPFCLTWSPSFRPIPGPANASAVLDTVTEFWREWS